MKALLPNIAAFGQRARKIREQTGIPLVRLCDDAQLPPSFVSRLETGQQKLDVYSLQDWERILAYVETLRDNSDALYDPRAVYRLLTVLGRTPTIDEMKQICSDIEYESLQKQFWRARPSVLPSPSQPVVPRDAEHNWLWNRAILKADAAAGSSAVRPWVDIAITGAPGMGKSTLAQMFAAAPEVLAYFPDGPLYASQQTGDARVWLTRWAEQYYLDLPEGVKTALWRDILRDQLKGLAVLVILDDVRDLAFVEALAVVDRQHSCAIMTTRQVGLVEQMGLAHDRVLHVSPMTAEQGIGLLQAFVSRETWTEKDDTAARQVVDQVGGAPQAIYIVGQHVAQVEAGQRARRWQGILRQLGRDRLMPFEGVQRTLDVAYADLGDLQSAYRALGAGASGAPITDDWAATVRGIPRPEARHDLRELAAHGLVARYSDDEMRPWYQAHMLIGEHASQQMNQTERDVAAERHALYLARLLLSDADSTAWEQMPTGLPHVDQLRQAATWCAQHLDTPEHIRLAQAVYLGASGHMALDGGLRDTLPVGRALCERPGHGRVLGTVMWTHGRALLDAGKPSEAATILEQGAQVLFECEERPAAACCLTDCSTAYYELGQPEDARRTAHLSDEWATSYEREMDAMLTAKDLNRARADRKALRRVNAVMEMPDKPSVLSTVAIRRMCALNAKRLAEDVSGRSVTMRRRPLGRLPWQPEDLVYAVTIRRIATFLLSGLAALPGQSGDETEQS